MVTVDMAKPSVQKYYNSLIEMYADWSADYIKADNTIGPYYAQKIEAINKAIKKTGCPIVLSLSAGPVNIERADHLRQNANLWRISGDMWDDWSYIIKTFEYCREWQDYIIPNHWLDCDILALEKLRINGGGSLAHKNKIPIEETIDEYTQFSDDEKYTHFTLWSIFRSPFMRGGDLLQLDNLTSQLLTN